MKLYFVRHGHTDASPNTIPDALTGEVDEPLNEEGIAQATALAEDLRDIHFDAIVSSPLKRAYETAQAANKYHELPIEINNVWRERGIGAYVTLETWHDLFDFDKGFSIEHSEDLEVFFRRIYDALDELKKDHEDQTVMLVSHSGVHQALYAYANKLPWEGNGRVSPLHNCEYRVYEL